MEDIERIIRDLRRETRTAQEEAARIAFLTEESNSIEACEPAITYCRTVTTWEGLAADEYLSEWAQWMRVMMHPQLTSTERRFWNWLVFRDPPRTMRLLAENPEVLTNAEQNEYEEELVQRLKPALDKLDRVNPTLWEQKYRDKLPKRAAKALTDAVAERRQAEDRIGRDR